MINLYNSSIRDIMPDNLKASPEVQALSYSLQKMNKKLLNYAKCVCIVTAIDHLSEDIVDLLAVELRTQYYNQEMDLQTKRNMVKETMQFYFYAGTPYAVEKIIESIFKTGKVLEWFDYEGEPGHFKIVTENHSITGNALERFNNIIKHVKRYSTVLDAVEIVLNGQMNVYYGAIMHTGDHIYIKQEG